MEDQLKLMKIDPTIMSKEDNTATIIDKLKEEIKIEEEEKAQNETNNDAIKKDEIDEEKFKKLKNQVKEFKEINDSDKMQIKALKEEIKELKEKINELKQLIKGPNELEMILAPQKRIIEQSQNDIINRQSQIIDILQENRGGIENKDEEIKRLKEIIEEKNEEIKKTKMIIADCSRNIMFGVKDHFQQEGRQSTVDIILF
jgi:chromosome segregation ATPase